MPEKKQSKAEKPKEEEGRKGNLEKGFVGGRGLSQGHKA